MEIKVAQIAKLTGHNGGIYSIVEGEAKHLILTAAGDGWVVQWDLVNPEVGRLVAKADKNIFSMRYILRPNQRLIVGDMDGGIHWIHLNNPDNQLNIAKHKSGVYDIQKIDNHIISIGGDGILNIWNIVSQQTNDGIKLSNQALRCLDYSSSRKEIAVGSSDRNIYLLDSSTFALKTVIQQAHTNSVFSVQYSPDGKYLMSGGRDAMLNVWEIDKDFEMISSQPAHLFTINKIIFHPEKNVFATASRDKTIKIWDSLNFQLLKVIDVIKYGGHINSVNTLFWSSYNNWLISGSDDRTAIVWDIEINHQ